VFESLQHKKIKLFFFFTIGLTAKDNKYKNFSWIFRQLYLICNLVNTQIGSVYTLKIVLNLIYFINASISTFFFRKSSSV
jgi:hypothetical protein